MSEPTIDELLEGLMAKPAAPPPERCAPVPWAGFLKMNQAGDHYSVGSGTLVTCPGQNVVLTAAHVVCDQENPVTTDGSMFYTQYSRTAQGAEEYAQSSAVEAIYVPPGFLPYESTKYDYAFIRLATPVIGGSLPVSFSNVTDAASWLGDMYLFGYPPAGDGTIGLCSQRAFADTSDLDTTERPCLELSAQTGFTSGASGGPVVKSYDQAAKTGTVMGILQGALPGSGQPRFNNLLIFTDEVEALFQQAQ